MEEAQSEICIPCDSLESFYLATNRILTRPEIVWKNVYFSYVTKHFTKYNTTTRNQDLSLEDFYTLPALTHQIVNLVTKNIQCSYIKRCLKLENGDIVTYEEKWDIKNHFIEIRIHGQYNSLMPATNYDLKFNVTDKIVTVSAYDESIEFKLTVEEKFRKIFSSSLDIKSGFKLITSLSHVQRSSYLETYQYLKEKYFSLLKEVWIAHGEKTDPNKFIPEDLHIATYLISLQIRSTYSGAYFGKKFIDFGCGNGALSFILGSEGWVGYGIDGRARKMWPYFWSRGIYLYEVFVDHSQLHRLPCDDETLVIGNHPDQLSPYVPLFTKLKNAACFFLLPCCAYDLFGHKFIRKGEGSVYESHMRELIHFSTQLGFSIKLDKLRIPSTKRIAIIGSPSPPNFNSFSFMHHTLKNLFDHESNNTKLDNSLVPIVRNATQIQRHLLEEAVLKIFTFILEEQKICSECTSYSDSNWPIGCTHVTFPMLIKTLRKELLQEFKNQGNGIQTLLRNYSYIFKVEENRILIRKPSQNFLLQKKTVGKIDKILTKGCFFFKNHPNGCPLSSNQCAFIH